MRSYLSLHVLGGGSKAAVTIAEKETTVRKMKTNRPSLLAAVARAGLSGAALLLIAPFTYATEVPHSGRGPLPGRAGDFALKVEPGVALPVGEPQPQIFKTGGGQTIKALWGVNRYLDLGPSATFMALPAATPMGSAGTAWAFGGSLRFKRPHQAPDHDGFFATSPWLDADALYVRTAQLNRPAFAVAAGLSQPIGESRVFWIGPFVRYLQVLQGERTGSDNRDAKVVSIGLSLEMGSGIERERGFVAANEVVVWRDKLELRETLYFGWDQATLEAVSRAALDDVVRALKDKRGFRVQVEGHASSDGADEHNQTLSERRANAVVDYLVGHGIEKERLVSKGFASSVPADTSATVAGGGNDRRVEFVVQFIMLNDRSK